AGRTAGAVSRLAFGRDAVPPGGSSRGKGFSRVGWYLGLSWILGGGLCAATFAAPEPGAFDCRGGSGRGRETAGEIRPGDDRRTEAESFRAGDVSWGRSQSSQSNLQPGAESQRPGLGR